MKKFALLWCVGSAIIASTILYIGATQNLHGDFCTNINASSCNFDILYAAGVWFSWFIPILAIGCILALAKLLVKKFRLKS